MILHYLAINAVMYFSFTVFGLSLRQAAIMLLVDTVVRAIFAAFGVLLVWAPKFHRWNGLTLWAKLLQIYISIFALVFLGGMYCGFLIGAVGTMVALLTGILHLVEPAIKDDAIISCLTLSCFDRSTATRTILLLAVITGFEFFGQWRAHRQKLGFSVPGFHPFLPFVRAFGVLAALLIAMLLKTQWLSSLQALFAAKVLIELLLGPLLFAAYRRIISLVKGIPFDRLIAEGVARAKLEQQKPKPPKDWASAIWTGLIALIFAYAMMEIRDLWILALFFYLGFAAVLSKRES